MNRKPPGIVCMHSAAGAIKASVQFFKAVCEKEKKQERKEENIIEEAEVRRRTLSSALGIESSESGRVPWVRLESVIGCITQAVRSSCDKFINNEGTLPLRFEIVLLLW